jgi:hypothetical protein
MPIRQTDREERDSSHPQKLSEELRRLLLERRALLQQKFDILDRRRADGLSDPDVPLLAKLELLEGDLELANSFEEMIAIRELHFSVCNDIEVLSEKKLSAGVGTINDKLVASIRRIESAISLLKERGFRDSN